MRRGAIVTVVLNGDLGKLRPAVIIQSELLEDVTSSVAVLPITSTMLPAPLLRVTVLPTPENGLRQPSQIMVDKLSSISRTKIG